jgi:hypothetical protein
MSFLYRVFYSGYKEPVNNHRLVVVRRMSHERSAGKSKGDRNQTLREKRAVICLRPRVKSSFHLAHHFNSRHS